MSEIDVTPVNEDSTHYFVRYLPPSMQEAYTRVPSSLSESTETTLRVAYRPGSTYETIRLHVWDMIEKAVKENRQIEEREMYATIMTRNHYRNILANVQLLAFILCPRVPYEVKIQQLLERSLERVEEILAVDIRDDRGVIDVKKAQLVMAAFKMLDMRKHGGYVQRIEEKSMQIHGSMKDAQKLDMEKKNLDEIESRIKQLEAEIKNPPKMIGEILEADYGE